MLGHRMILRLRFRGWVLLHLSYLTAHALLESIFIMVALCGEKQTSLSSSWSLASELSSSSSGSEPDNSNCDSSLGSRLALTRLCRSVPKAFRFTEVILMCCCNIERGGESSINVLIHPGNESLSEIPARSGKAVKLAQKHRGEDFKDAASPSRGSCTYTNAANSKVNT